MKKAELRFTGSGGQGVIMATIILAEAAYADKLQAVQSQSYGPEARGGSAKQSVLSMRNQSLTPRWYGRICCFL